MTTFTKQRDDALDALTKRQHIYSKSEILHVPDLFIAAG